LVRSCGPRFAKGKWSTSEAEQEAEAQRWVAPTPRTTCVLQGHYSSTLSKTEYLREMPVSLLSSVLKRP
jgi:hypothetical protein